MSADSRGGDHDVDARCGPYRDTAPERLAQTLAHELALSHLDEARALRAAVERVSARKPARGLLVGMVSGAALTATVAVVWLGPLVADGPRLDARTTRAHITRLRVEHELELARLGERIEAMERATARGGQAPAEEEDAPSDGLEIVPVGRNEFVIARSLLTRGAESHPSIRLLPHETAGVVLGVRLYGVQTHSALARLGFENGDTLLRVNGLSLTTPESAIRACDAIRDSSSAEVSVLRRGRRVTLRYTILG